MFEASSELSRAIDCLSEAVRGRLLDLSGREGVADFGAAAVACERFNMAGSGKGCRCAEILSSYNGGSERKRRGESEGRGRRTKAGASRWRRQSKASLKTPPDALVACIDAQRTVNDVKLQYVPYPAREN